MSEGIRILCEQCPTEFQVDEGCTDVYVKCPTCKHVAPSGISLRYEPGAPQPYPSGELVKRATWRSSKDVGYRCQRDLILSRRKSIFVVSFFKAVDEGRRPKREWEKALPSSVDPDAEFRNIYNELRDEHHSASSIATANPGTKVKATEKTAVKATEPGMPSRVRKENEKARLVRYSVDGD